MRRFFSNYNSNLSETISKVGITFELVSFGLANKSLKELNSLAKTHKIDSKVGIECPNYISN